MAERTCAVDDCDRPVHGHGWCQRHLRFWQRNGDLAPRRLRGYDDFSRIFAKVDTSGDCWHWTGGRDAKGYGLYATNEGVTTRAHRTVYETLVGPVPEGMTLDHLCRNTACVNPDHLEVVTGRVNTLRGYNPAATNARKTHCLRGHEFAGDNLIVLASGARQCRTCRQRRDRDRQRMLRARRKAGAYASRS